MEISVDTVENMASEVRPACTPPVERAAMLSVHEVVVALRRRVTHAHLHGEPVVAVAPLLRRRVEFHSREVEQLSEGEDVT